MQQRYSKQCLCWLKISASCVAADDNLAVRKASTQTRTEAKTVEHQHFSRQARGTRSVRPSRSVLPRTSGTVSHTYHQALLMQATLRMHRNPLPLMTVPSAAKQPAPTVPVPSDWTTVSTLRNRRRYAAPLDKEDSFIVPPTDELHDASVSGKPLKVLLEPASDVEEPLPTDSVRPPSPPPVPVRQPRKPRRRTVADVGNNNSLVSVAGSRLSVSVDKEPLPANITVPTNVDSKETDVDSVVETSGQQCNIPKAAARRSLVFEKVPMDVGKPIVKPRRRATERHLPLQESSV